MKYLRWSLVLTGIMFCKVMFAQEAAPERAYHFNGQISATNNGFSFIPTFSLNKPATVFDLSAGSKRFSFDPQFRFGLDGLKPWSFIFIWRYAMVQQERWSIRLGTHLPALSFRREKVVSATGSTYERIFVQRFFTPEFTADYQLSPHVSLGAYYLMGFGLEPAAQTKHTNFLSVRAGVKWQLWQQVHMKWDPQVYYLLLDGRHGYFTAQSLTLQHSKWPLALTYMLNNKLKSELNTRAFDWNLSLVYSFKNELTKNAK